MNAQATARLTHYINETGDDEQTILEDAATITLMGLYCGECEYLHIIRTVIGAN